jgi:hypothetical protein
MPLRRVVAAVAFHAIAVQIEMADGEKILV